MSISEMQKKHLLVYVDGWTVHKSLLHEQKLQKPLEIPNFRFANRLKVQVDSFLTTGTVLENRIKIFRKQGYIYIFSFLTKIGISEI